MSNTTLNNLPENIAAAHARLEAFAAAQGMNLDESALTAARDGLCTDRRALRSLGVAALCYLSESVVELLVLARAVAAELHVMTVAALGYDDGRYNDHRARSYRVMMGWGSF